MDGDGEGRGGDGEGRRISRQDARENPCASRPQSATAVASPKPKGGPEPRRAPLPRPAPPPLPAPRGAAAGGCAAAAPQRQARSSRAHPKQGARAMRTSALHWLQNGRGQLRLSGSSGLEARQKTSIRHLGHLTATPPEGAGAEAWAGLPGGTPFMDKALKGRARTPRERRSAAPEGQAGWNPSRASATLLRRSSSQKGLNEGAAIKFEKPSGRRRDSDRGWGARRGHSSGCQASLATCLRVRLNRSKTVATEARAARGEAVWDRPRGPWTSSKSTQSSTQDTASVETA